MRLPAVKKRRGAGHSIGDAFTGKSNSLTKQGYLESDRDFFENNRRAAVWFLENRDKLAEAMTGKTLKKGVTIKRELFIEIIDVFSRMPCRFFACRGPSKRWEAQVTCTRCGTLRSLLLFAKKEGIETGNEDMLVAREE
jgi:hypothetical protein